MHIKHSKRAAMEGYLHRLPLEPRFGTHLHIPNMSVKLLIRRKLIENIPFAYETQSLFLAYKLKNLHRLLLLNKSLEKSILCD